MVNINALLTAILISVLFFSCQEKSERPASEKLIYGLSFYSDKMSVAAWAPEADSVILNIYHDCGSKESYLRAKMDFTGSDDWVIILPDTLLGKTYTFQIFRNGKGSREVVDPYVKAVCANGNRAAFMDISKTNPIDWTLDKTLERSENEPLILYELHVRDFSMDPNSGMENKGKYLAFSQTNSTGINGQPTGLNHIKSLGVTHIHLLPVFDFASIDETLQKPNYNWGYDPQNYFVPEGSYSTYPNTPKNRINEFKSMVKSIHNEGMGVIMDVVYNHTYYLDNSSFQVWAPGYYYRQNEDGSYSNASACGNELATEKDKVREMIIASLRFWVDEYHIDGFRFDLMGIMDTETMNLISAELKSINPGIVLYGEGWLAGNSPLPDSLRAIKANMKTIPKYSAFSDEIRDGIKGHWSDERDKGFVSGKLGLKPSVKFGITGGVEHQQINYNQVNNSDFAWAKHPWQCINYVSCHDNHTLIDKLKISSPESSDEELKQMHLLAQSIVLSSQGIPFLHAGTEFFRTKFGDHNSFESPDSINMIDWSLAVKHPESIQYIKDLISFRKINGAFWLTSAEDVNNKIEFFDTDKDAGIYYILKSNPEESEFNSALFIFLGLGQEESIPLPEGEWTLRFDNFKKIDTVITKKGAITVKGPNAVILVI